MTEEKNRVDRADCVEWDGSVNWRRGGYGQRRYQGKVQKAHRVAWIEKHGSIPKGMFVCHRCDNPKCVNVEHLFLGTNRDNMLDMAAKGRSSNQKKTHCLRGHVLSSDNLMQSRLPHRICRVCHKERKRERYKKLREQGYSVLEAQRRH